MALAFGFSLVVQWNDPDPLPWMVIYGAALLVCFLEIAGRTRIVPPLLVAAGALVWAGTIAPRVLGTVGFGEMFGGFEMRDVGVEESREMYGLLLVACWSLAVATAAWRRRPPPPAPPAR